MDPRFYCAAYQNLAGWSYKLKGPKTSLKQTNCCIAAERILKQYFPDAGWSSQTHADLMIMGGARPWSPMDAIEAAGVGHPVSGPLPGRWHLVQMWADADALKRGHTCFYYEPAVGPVASVGFIIEATDADVVWFRECSLTDKLSGRDCRLAVLDL